MFGRKKNQLNICLLSETNMVKDSSLEAYTLHAENSDTAEAWGLDSNQQCKDEKTRQYLQFISSLCCTPIKIYRDPNHNGVNRIKPSLVASQTEDQELTFIDQGSNKDGKFIWLAAIVSMIVFGVLIAGYIMMQRG